ncbi:hypothetical protein ACFDR9_003423 [Janthinobacterium sp. CG_23.3]|uniref:hypothetical protein n=1 Tax=unclassified Janthinobacterium TaxID=2610881 RepID=UPI00034CD9C2|nr:MULTISPECIES: hypothetical protein [unclassified Janthinobacterium]MEC5163672.1 hypothetical protein [Janthinobacterium sp. CG_S6]
MSAQAQRIELDAARAGMVLAGDLRDANGSVLLPDGATLTEANLASLRRRGVDACSVLPADAGDAAEDAAARAARVAQQLRRLERLFRRSAAEEATPRLLQLLTTYRENG